MTIAIPRPKSERASLDEYVELFRQADPPPKDAEALAETAPLLARLFENRDFVAEWMVNDLVTRAQSQTNNLYSAQSTVMAQLSKHYFLRVNFWPATNDEVVKKTGGGMFAYQLPHDHNFNFMTVGYWGPGYKSDYFEYDSDSVAGYPGEEAKLRFVETRYLQEGDLMVYRAHRDVHTQHPPQEMSITINVMDQSPALSHQYIFDQDAAHIAKVVDSRSIPQFLNLAASVLGERAFDRLIEVSRLHEDPAVRFHALRAASRAAPDPNDATGLFTRAMETNDASLRGWISAYLRLLERQGRASAPPSAN